MENELLKVKVDKYRPIYYASASGDFNAIHIDNDFAKKVGLPGVILHGLCTMAYVYRGIIKNEDPYKLKGFKVRFKSPVVPGDEITVKGQSTVENNTKKYEVVATKQDGTEVITNASAVVES